MLGVPMHPNQMLEYLPLGHLSNMSPFLFTALHLLETFECLNLCVQLRFGQEQLSSACADSLHFLQVLCLEPADTI